MRWEYLTIDLAYLPARTDEVDVLNDAGGQGWELVAIMINGVAYLRRQVVDPASAPANADHPPGGKLAGETTAGEPPASPGRRVFVEQRRRHGRSG